MKRLAPLLLAVLLLSACQEESTKESSSVNLESFFASVEFVREDTPVGDSENYIYPFDVEDPYAWTEELYEADPSTDHWAEIQARMEQDYPKFDPLLLLENNPETLVENFKAYNGEETLSEQDVQRMQTLKTILEEMQTETQRWVPGATAYVLTPPENFPGWYGPSEDGEPEPDQYLFYVDWDTWEETTDDIWQNQDYSWDWERPEGTITFFDRTKWSSFAHRTSEEGFFLAEHTSYEYSNGDGGGAGSHNTLYVYDQVGRLTESFTLMEGEGPMTDTTLFTYTYYGYENDQLKFVRISTSLLESTQLSIPRIAYYHSRYWAKAF